MAHVLAKDLRDSILEAAFKGELSSYQTTDSKIQDYQKEILKEAKITSKKDVTKMIAANELKGANRQNIMKMGKRWLLPRSATLNVMAFNLN